MFLQYLPCLEAVHLGFFMYLFPDILLLHIDKNNSIRESRKDTSKDMESTKAPRGSNRNNVTNVKWAKGTKEGKMDNKPSK